MGKSYVRLILVNEQVFTFKLPEDYAMYAYIYCARAGLGSA